MATKNEKHSKADQTKSRRKSDVLGIVTMNKKRVMKKQASVDTHSKTLSTGKLLSTHSTLPMTNDVRLILTSLVYSSL